MQARWTSEEPTSADVAVQANVHDYSLRACGQPRLPIFEFIERCSHIVGDDDSLMLAFGLVEQTQSPEVQARYFGLGRVAHRVESRDITVAIS